jgi:hypothetical protein
MFAQPSKAHEFFYDLLGQWTFEHRCDAGPDLPVSNTTGRMSARSMGGLWLLIDCEGDNPEGGTWSSQFILGYDPAKEKYVGSFVASMMTHQWLYEGQVEASGRKLVMDTQGPSFEGEGMKNYRDIFEIVDEDHWILRSEMEMPDGSWKEFLEGHQRRAK